MAKIIAEIGNNHEGSINTALELLEKAKEAGAHFVKFQAGTAKGFAREQKDVERYKKYELGRTGYDKLIKRGAELNIPVFFSVWSDEFSDYRKLDYYKIASRQCNVQTIEKYTNNGTFISVPHSIENIKALKIKSGVVLHCVSEYPAHDPMWHRLLKLRLETGRPTGFSDHFIGIAHAVQAAIMGAEYIEKHFTLKHDFGPLRDHALSATPDEMRRLIEEVGN